MNSNIQNMRSSYSYLKIKRFVGDEENDYLEREEEEEEEQEDENMEGQKSNFEVKIENEKKRKKKEVGDGFSGSSGIDDFCCVVEKCEADLRLCKNYHQRHRVCELHAKAPSVMVGGFMQRFCQQCSRFHELSEFDQTKRSCRKRLASHNERRRKSSLES